MPLVKIHNHTSLILNIAFAQVCPLQHSNEVKPFERLEKTVGAVWFTIECKVDNGKNRYSFARSALSLSLICSTSLSIASLIVVTAIPSSALVGGSAAATALIQGIAQLSRLAPVLWPSAIKRICEDHGLEESEVKGVLESVGTAAAAATAFGEGKGWITGAFGGGKTGEKPSLPPPPKKSKGRGNDSDSSDEEDSRPSKSKDKGNGKDKNQSEVDGKPENKDLVSQTLTNIGFASTTVNMIDAGRNMFSTLSRSFSRKPSEEQQREMESEEEEVPEPHHRSGPKARRSLDFGSIKRPNQFSPTTGSPSSSSFKQHSSKKQGSETQKISSPPVSFKYSSKSQLANVAPSSFKPAESSKDGTPLGSVSGSSQSTSDEKPSPFVLKTKTWRPGARAGGKEAELFQSAPVVPTLKPASSSPSPSPSTTAPPARSATTRRPPVSYKQSEKAMPAKPSPPPLTDERDARVWGHAAKWKSASSSNLLADLPSSKGEKGRQGSKKKSYRYNDDDEDEEEWSRFNISEVNEARRALGFKDVSIPTSPPPPYSSTDPDPIPASRVGWKAFGQMLRGAMNGQAAEEQTPEAREPEFLVETSNGSRNEPHGKTGRQGSNKPDGTLKRTASTARSSSSKPPKGQRSSGRKAPIPGDAEMRVYCVYMGWSEREFSIREGDGKFELWDEANGEKIG